jgi:4-hydroxybenzoate polyprenyltransferase
MPAPLALLHPFPSALDAVAAAAVAIVAGAGLVTSCGVALAMALIQTSIGSANDLFDSGHDRLAQPGKPLPSGRVGRRFATGYAILAGIGGLLVARALGPLPAAVATAGFAAGLAYDAWLNRTAWSWLPYALGLPLLPAFGWAAARQQLPADFATLVALGSVAGAALAIGNGLVDLEADAAAGGGGLACRLGRRRAERVLVVLQALLVAAAGAVVAGGTRAPASMALLLLAVPMIVSGVLLSWAQSIARRELGWEAQAVGVALLALAWLSASQPGPMG